MFTTIHKDRNYREGFPTSWKAITDVSLNGQALFVINAVGISLKKIMVIFHGISTDNRFHYVKPYLY